MKTLSQRRRHPRVSLGVSLDIRFSGEGAPRCRATISDMSSGGMALQTDAQLESGMTLHLKLPSELEIRGEIRHAGSPVNGLRRYGVRFHKIGHGYVAR